MGDESGSTTPPSAKKKHDTSSIEERVDRLLACQSHTKPSTFSSPSSRKKGIFFVKEQKSSKSAKKQSKPSPKKSTSQPKARKTKSKHTKQKTSTTQKQPTDKKTDTATQTSPDVRKWLDLRINKSKKPGKEQKKTPIKKPRNFGSFISKASSKKTQHTSPPPSEPKQKPLEKTTPLPSQQSTDHPESKEKQDHSSDTETSKPPQKTPQPDPQKIQDEHPKMPNQPDISSSTPLPPKEQAEFLTSPPPDQQTESPVSDQQEQEMSLDDITPDGQIQFEHEAKALKTVTLEKLGYPQGAWKELDFYPLIEPFAYAEIIQENDTLDKRYVLVEVDLSDEEQKLLKFMTETISGFSIDTEELDSMGEEDYLIEKTDQVISDYALKINNESQKKIIYFLKKQFLGLGKLEILMKDSQIEDISCDGAGISFFVYHRRYGSLKSNVVFESEDELSDFVMKLAQKCGKHISIAEPMLDATMPDGSRLQMTLSTEVTTKGSTFTIRKFKEDPFSPPDLIEFNTMSADMVAYLWMAVENGVNALVAGGTAAGKTSTLNAFSLFIPRESKIVSIEETREINLPHPNWIPGVARSGFGEVVGGKVVGEIDMYDLMKAALRQRPEYILVGEIRGREAYVLFQAMATGHTTYSTVHADSASSLIHRLEGKPINIPRIMLQALDIVCIQVISRIKNKRARRCKQIIEIIDIDPTTKEILTNEVFRWDPVEDDFIYNGKSYILERIRAEKDMDREEISQELKRRGDLLNWMNTNNVREFKKVATLLAQYAENPAQLMEKLSDGKLL